MYVEERDQSSISARTPRDDPVLLSIAARSQPDICHPRSNQHKVQSQTYRLEQSIIRS